MAPIAGELDLIDPRVFDSMMKKKFHSKISIDGCSPSGGGGGTGARVIRIKHPTLTERMHRANFVIFVDRRDGVHVAKNRSSGKTGNVSTKELINILTRILVEHIFDGRMKVFQEGMRWRLKGAINKIVKDGA